MDKPPFAFPTFLIVALLSLFTNTQRSFVPCSFMSSVSRQSNGVRQALPKVLVRSRLHCLRCTVSRNALTAEKLSLHAAGYSAVLLQEKVC